MNNEYLLGLDIGTNSVGHAVTDTEYNICKFNGKSMWGVHLFDEAAQAAERRAARTSRRRLARVKQRVTLIQELFACEIAKADENFYKRLNESFLYREDRESDTTNSIFADKDYTDKSYHKEYPTIHHLIMDLINDKSPHDVRLVYLAVSYIVSHRGHFLYEVNKEDIDKLLSFNDVYESFKAKCEDDTVWYGADIDKLSELFINTQGITKTKNALTQLLFDGKKPSKQDAEIIKALSGGEFKASVLFENEAYTQLESDKLSFSKADIEDVIESIQPELGEDIDTLIALKGIYDWAAIARMMNGGKEKYISNAKIAQYEKHKQDLKALKKFVKKYIPEKYNEIFKTAYKNTPNYAAYSKNYKSSKIADKDYKSATVEAFSDYIRKLFKSVTPVEADIAEFERMMSELSEYRFMPKQKNTDNRLIPYQLYWYELKSILDNAKTYLAFLNDKDADGISVYDKILSVFEFKIPYYVGPLCAYRSENAWIERKKSGRILPWNFDETVDKDASEEAFIRRMTSKCTYLAGKDVLPKNSLLYSKFMVLNEINKIKYDNIALSAELKQELYTDLFLNSTKRVSKKSILAWLKNKKGIEASEITGIDDVVKSSLKPYHIFKRYIESKMLSENDVEKIIERITITTDKRRLKKWLKNEFDLNDNDIAYISSQKLSEYGRLSKEFLCGIESVNKETGEILTVIGAMWETNYNLMELLSSDFGYSEVIAQSNNEYYAENDYTVSDMLDEMYVSNAVKRSIFRTLDIFKEIRSIKKCDPKKIFIEVTRGEGEKVRTVSRKNQLLEKYKAVKDAEYASVVSMLKDEDESKLRSKKLYLYYSQLGRCMYTGEPIKLDILMSDNSAYDIDHIYPQARVKDDSFDNMALVTKDANGKKSDNYPIFYDIRNKMQSFWKMLLDKKLISQQKYYRLTRSTSFKDEELSGFINRQLVETSQAVKAVATILGNLCPDTEIVYVKSHLASEFRHVFGMEKCREINDFHHAKDAYLNIVMGNIYNVKFTKNPINFIRADEKNRKYTIKLTEKEGQGLLSRDIERNGETAWKGDGSSLAVVKKTMRRNDINYVRYAFCRKGQLFNLNASRKGENLVPIKKGLDTLKYGGYNSKTATYFSLVKHIEKGKDVISILPVDLMIADKFESDDDFAINYFKDKLENPIFIRKTIKINTLIEFENGFRANIAATSGGGRQLVLASATSLILSAEQEKYAKRILSKLAKAKEMRVPLKISPEFDKITKEENLALYDTLINKTKSKVFSKISAFANLGKLMTENRGTFETLSVEEQMSLISSVILYFKTGRTTGCDITLIGGSKQSGKIYLNTKINSDIRIIDQSPTGLFEKKSDSILKL